MYKVIKGSLFHRFYHEKVFNNIIYSKIYPILYEE